MALDEEAEEAEEANRIHLRFLHSWESLLVMVRDEGWVEQEKEPEIPIPNRDLTGKEAVCHIAGGSAVFRGW